MQLFYSSLCFFGWMILTLLFTLFGMRDGSLRVADDRGRIVFRKRVSRRIGLAMFGIFFVVGILFPASQGFVDAVQHHQAIPVSAYFGFWFCGLLASGFGGLSLFASGPQDIYLDKERHTYRYVWGWPHCPYVQTGPWQDMAGVYVRRVQSRGRATYFVQIAWRQERRNCPMLGEFWSEYSADALADEVAATLGLPRVIPPPYDKTSVDPAHDSLPSRDSLPPPFRPFRPTPMPSKYAMRPEKPDQSQRG